MDPHQANLLMLGSRLRFNPTLTFLGVTFDRTLSFSKHVSSLKAKLFSRLKALRCISASSWGPSKESLSGLYKSFLRLLLTYASPGWFPFLSATNLTKLERFHRAASRAITGCLSSSPIPLLLTEASLPPLRVTLTHFTLFSYERALRFPTSFPISGLARLGVKPRLCRSPGELLRPLTRSCFLLLVLGGLLLLALPFLLGICSRSRWSPPFPLHALALIPLTLAKVRLSPSLTLSPLMIRYSGLTALFLFLSARAAPAYLPTALSVALRPLFPFRQAQYAQVFWLKPAPFCTLFAGLGSTNKSAISLLLSSYLTLVLSTTPCPLLHLSCYLKLCGRNCLLSPVLSGYNGSPDSFIPGNDTADELARRGALLAPSAIPCSLFPLTSRIHSRLFLDWRRTVSSKYFDTQVPSISTEELVLPRHARCVLSRLRCNGHSLLLGSCTSRIGRIGNPSCSACGHSSQDTSHLIVHCPATDSLRRSLFGDSLSLYDLWSRPWGVARLLGLHGVPPCPHPSEGVG